MDSKLANETQASTEQLLKDLKEVVADGEELLRAGASELSEKGSPTRERLSSAMDSAKETGRKLQERAAAGAQVTDRVIREHPYETIGLALGIGFVLGVLINRK